MTPSERTAVVDSAIQKIRDQLAAAVAANAEIQRINDLLAQSPSREEFNRLQAELVTASAALAEAVGELKQVDEDLARLQSAVQEQ